MNKKVDLLNALHKMQEREKLEGISSATKYLLQNGYTHEDAQSVVENLFENVEELRGFPPFVMGLVRFIAEGQLMADDYEKMNKLLAACRNSELQIDHICGGWDNGRYKVFTLNELQDLLKISFDE